MEDPPAPSAAEPASARPPRAAEGTPLVLQNESLDPASPLGAWLACPDATTARAHAAAATAAALGDFAEVTGLLPQRERWRAELLVAAVALGGAHAAGRESAERRLADFHRLAYRLARALAEEPADAAVPALFAEEQRRRGFTRPALDELLALARERVRERRPRTPEDAARRAERLALALATALFGVEPAESVVSFLAALVRLLELVSLPADLAAGTAALPLSELAEPLQYRSVEEIARAVSSECAALEPMLLRGGRAGVEVPLTFRRPFAYLLPLAFKLHGAIESDPRALARRAPRLGRWTRRLARFRARRERLD
jgi:hypothetical protein